MEIIKILFIIVKNLQFNIMNTRLTQFLSAENITQSQFADTLGVARASISHIMAGRNKPGYEFITSLIKCYPNLNIEWLLLGKGKMYRNNDISDSPIIEEDIPDNLFSPKPEVKPTLQVDPALVISQEPQPVVVKPKEIPQEVKTPSANKTILKVIAFYSDGTFQELK